MRLSTLSLFFFLIIHAHAQVLDVNGDQTVGPEEAIAVAEHWKGPAGAANAHDHLGQTWKGNRNPLVIRGNFPDRQPFIPIKSKGIGGFETIPQAPLILDNTSTEGHGLIVESENIGASLSGTPALVLGGGFAIVTTEETGGSLSIQANDFVQILFDIDGESDSTFQIAGPEGLVASFSPNGDLFLSGQLHKSAGQTRIDHPLDPANKYLSHSSVSSPDMMNIYRGNVVLDDLGGAEVELPKYFEAFNADFNYHLTPIGAPAPNLHVAQKIKENQFKIAGGQPNQEISWQVTGVRQDAYAKANRFEVEQEKSEVERGKYLHPEMYGEPRSQGVGLVNGMKDE